ncbi:putative amino acid tansporter [Trypanosoma grayi]|uniref:putative amino acid tansporter n=1 Tax=Trypanosoma grayi TaxID=71804 RepID=UPI0004F3EFE7|nr:putative amino acid tansporter [Trypanosoma grayi]KEG15113.1 putative amino acid tansporter [Trypanosoma grayi]
MSSPHQPMALLVPKQLQHLIMDGSAEVVVEKRTSGQKRLFLHLFDEGEREEVVRRRVETAAVHERALEDLRWARATLWGDERLRRYLYTPDWLTWPSFAELSGMVDLVRSAKETDVVPDFVGANTLKKAVNIIGQEMLYPGLHPLKEETLAGPLLAFEGTPGDGCVVGDTLSPLDADDQRRLGNSVWGLDLHAPVFTADEVTRLPLTGRVREECVRVLQPGLSAAGVESSWAALVGAHRRRTEAHLLGLFCGVPDCLQQFGMTVVHLAKEVNDAAEEGRRVRLRVGIYLTLLQRNEAYVMGNAEQQGAAVDDETALRSAFERATGHSYDTNVAAGLVLWAVEGETVEDVLGSRFLSPLASAHECMETVSLTPSVHMTRVVVRHNPFAVIHGHRVVGAFPENSEARAALSDLLVSREGATHAAPPQRSLQQQQRNATTIPFSSTLTGEQLRRGVDEAVFKTLSQEPMAKAALSTHANMTRFRDLPNFEAVLKDSLKRNTEYRGRKYYLKE